MNNLRYSIIYAVIRPEIAERISVGLMYEFVSRVVSSMPTNGSVNSVEAINYVCNINA